MVKGIVLAGGAGSRLYPATLGVSKQAIPIYDKPMIYYPIAVLMLAEIRDILIISTAEDLPGFKRLLGDGSNFGVRFEYVIQPSPDGLAQAFLLGEDFLAGDSACLILGDNIYYGHGLSDLLLNAKQTVNEQGGGAIFASLVHDPERYGVVEFDPQGKVLSIEEKPAKPKSHYAATGLYFYDNQVVDFAKQIKPSARGELEITDLNNLYLKNSQLSVEQLGRGFAWLDTGTHESLIEASRFVSTVENRQGLKIACLEEIAFHNQWIGIECLESRAKLMAKTKYGQYIQLLVEENRQCMDV